MWNNPPYLASLAVYTLGALTFCVLAASYWRDRWRRPARGRTILPVFTLVCGVAFAANLLSRQGMESFGLEIVRNLAAGVIPALIVHFIFDIERTGLRRPRLWQRIVIVFYAAAIASALIRIAIETGWFSIPAAEAVYRAPAVLFGAVALAGLLLQASSQRDLQVTDRAHRRSMYLVLVLMLLCAVANFAGPAPLARQLSDYLLLAFFCLNLYYQERLVFFDLLVKRGVFLLLGVAVVALSLITAEFLGARGSAVASSMVAAALVLWLTGPWVYARLARAVDRSWLCRPFSPEDAERKFLHDVEAAAGEKELSQLAARSLGEIFQSAAEVHFGDSAKMNGNSNSVSFELIQNGSRRGVVSLAGRPNGVPFLSGDRRLLQTLSAALILALDNIRFRVERRSQEEREQQLRLLASRAELKALRAQINPHFLFNALSVIAGLVHSHPALAEETIEHLAQVFRYTLRKSDNEWTPLHEELEFVTAYLEIEKARFGEKLKVDIDIGPDVANISVPAMSIQPLVENAVKHGAAAIEGRGLVRLRAVMEDEFLKLEVFDNGPGFPPGFSIDQASGGHGLRNVAERLSGYFGDGASLSWTSNPGKTLVQIKIPQTSAAPIAAGASR